MESGLSERMKAALEELDTKQTSCAANRKPAGQETINLSSGQNEVLRPELVEFLKTTVEDKLTENTFAYPSPAGGDAVLREALSSFFNAYLRPIHTVKQEHIVVTAGATDAIESVIHAVCDDGDGVIVPGPYWAGFKSILKARANVNVVVAQPPTYQHYDNYLLPSLQAAYDFSADKCRIKAVLLCNPHNPLSICYPKKALVECMEFCQERGLHFICDEVYALSSLNGPPGGSMPFVSSLSLTEPLVPEGAVKIDPSRVHVVWSASKLFGVSALRVGCLISQQNPQLVSAISMITSNHASNVASLGLSALLKWSQLPTLLALNSERLTESYRILAHTLQEANIDFVTPTDGIFLFAKLAKRAQTAEEEAAFFDRLAKRGILVAPGRKFQGVERDFGWGRLRFSVPTSIMKVAAERIAAFLKTEA